MDVTDLSDDYLLCRDPGFRHRWDPMRVNRTSNVFEEGKERGELLRKSQCARCGAVREEVFRHSRSGVTKVRNRYVYPEGYVIKDGVRIVGADVWAERYKRGF